MIIKLYTRGAVNHLHIIENVSRVHYAQTLHHPNLDDAGPSVKNQSFEHLDMSGEKYIRILFTDNKSGEEQGVLVYNHAYICNDDGKTIDKVFVSSYFDNGLNSTEETKKVA